MEQKLSQKLSIRDLDLRGKKVLMRVDFNVPIDEEGSIRDPSRILAALPTIRYALKQGASVILLSHMGRPKGKKDPSASLAICLPVLEKELECKVKFVPDCQGEQVAKAVAELKPGELVLLENLRFYPAEEDPSKDPQFAANLAKLGDLYVNDAFGAAHRAHSSITELPKFFPQAAAQGFLLQQEVEILQQLLKNPVRPFAVVVGGAKASSKLPLLKALTRHLDILMIGGAMAFTFLKVLGYSVGSSLWEKEYVTQAKELIDHCHKQGVRLLLPVDFLVVPKEQTDAAGRVICIEAGIPDGEQGVDIGPATISLFAHVLEDVATVFWNGPMGIFEVPAFAEGTRAIARAISQVKECSIVGGGDSLAAVQMMGLGSQMTHLSTGGGASLEYLEQGSLVGVDSLSTRSG